MGEILQEIVRILSESQARELALYLLSNVPGFPPVIQTVHLLSIAAVMGSIVLIDLRVLGLALPGQNLREMIHRLMPWTFSALALLFISGAVLVLARPARYFYNPVFGWKFALLLPAVVLALIFYLLSVRASSGTNHFWELSPAHLWSSRVIALLSLLLWLGVTMAGRWIAYTEYLFYPA